MTTISSNSHRIKSDPAWDELCEIAAKLNGFDTRREALAEACRLRPDLASKAVYPTGEPLPPAAIGAPPVHGPRATLQAVPVPGYTTPQSAPPKAAKPQDSPLVKAAEKRAALYAASQRRQ